MDRLSEFFVFLRFIFIQIFIIFILSLFLIASVTVIVLCARNFIIKF